MILDLGRAVIRELNAGVGSSAAIVGVCEVKCQRIDLDPPS